MQTRTITARPRSTSGKGPARRLRAQGEIPAVAYGKQLAAVALSVSPKDLLDVLEGEFGSNTVIELALESGEKLSVLTKEYQYHPVTRELLHADFIQVDLSQPVDVEVPLELTGRAKGVVLGGNLHQARRSLPIRCLPAQIPAKLTKDVTELGLDEGYSVADLDLPEGVSVRLPAKQTVVLVAADRRRQAAEAAAAEAAEAEAGKKK